MNQTQRKTEQRSTHKRNIYKFICLCIVSSLLGCSRPIFIYTNPKPQSADKLEKIENMITNSSNFASGFFSKRKYFIHNDIKTDLFLIKNKSDNRIYAGVKKCKYILPLEIDNDTITFKVYENKQLIISDTITNCISIVFKDDNKRNLKTIGRDQLLVRNHFGVVCEFDSLGRLEYCIKSKHVFNVDRTGTLRETYLY